MANTYSIRAAAAKTLTGNERMSEKHEIPDFKTLLQIDGVARSITHQINALIVLPTYEANKEIIASYQDRLSLALKDMKELLK